MKWEELTSPKIAALDKSIPVVMNIAAIEQHGPHLPLATDALIGEHFISRLNAERGEQVLVLPQIKVCCSRHHMDFAGTLTASHTTLLEYISEIAASVFQAGFQTFVLLNSHGGNQAIGQVAVEKIGADYPDRQVALATWWSLAREELKALSESGPFGTGHACELETSLIQLIAPHLVEAPVPDGLHYERMFAQADGDMLSAGSASLYRSMKEISGGSGVVGAVETASAEKGQRISDIVTAQLVRFVDELRDYGTRRTYGN
ncbi:creatininase family protein [Rhodobacteraceae bacterium RKSG542]|uniref:creatininase family protein n=1 Tax=Pseudovibrio flavus TaxID=2529854 RepID=UPI0012BBB719|nr:creatininase family protein [Pseudovibrio flavus]MTI16457.1 creatininase family protein [Pseudovibrio flavus]